MNPLTPPTLVPPPSLIWFLFPLHFLLSLALYFLPYLPLIITQFYFLFLCSVNLLLLLVMFGFITRLILIVLTLFSLLFPGLKFSLPAPTLPGLYSKNYFSAQCISASPPKSLTRPLFLLIPGLTTKPSVLLNVETLFFVLLNVLVRPLFYLFTIVLVIKLFPTLENLNPTF